MLNGWRDIAPLVAAALEREGCFRFVGEGWPQRRFDSGGEAPAPTRPDFVIVIRARYRTEPGGAAYLRSVGHDGRARRTRDGPAEAQATYPTLTPFTALPSTPSAIIPPAEAA